MSDIIPDTNHININIVKVIYYHLYIYRYHTDARRMSVEQMNACSLLQGCVNLFVAYRIDIDTEKLFLCKKQNQK